jgi:hypothetical protein
MSTGLQSSTGAHPLAGAAGRVCGREILIGGACEGDSGGYDDKRHVSIATTNEGN